MIGTNSYGLANSGNEAAPALADIDGDGDLDLLSGNVAGDTVFYRNTGTSLSPTFSLEGTDPFGIANIPQGGALPALADIDGDGDLDLFIGNHAGTLQFYSNTGTRTAPTFSLQGTNLFGLAKADDYAAPALKDIDGDGDVDLVDKNVVYINTGTMASPTFSLVGTNAFMTGDPGG